MNEKKDQVLFDRLMGDCNELGVSKPFVREILTEVLLEPVEDLISRPSKGFRGELVELGFRFCRPDGEPGEEKIWHGCAEIVELLHAGSLAIDDIQDGSLERRGQPALHRRYGVPLALNVGNWLYFWPLALVRELGLPADRELAVYQAYHETMLRAHMGQAIDVGVRIDQVVREHIYSTCLKSLELKSGALTAFAVSIGAIAIGGSAEKIKILQDFGTRFGMALQMFDDLGNVLIAHEKQFEDLGLRRPTWIWACLSSLGSESDLTSFRDVVRQLPDSVGLQDWISKNRPFLEECRSRAEGYLKHSLEIIRQEDAIFNRFADLGEKLSRAYG